MRWRSPENEILLNPRMPADEADRLRSALAAAAHLRGHVFLLTSGTTSGADGGFKWVALAKEAILAAAEASNRRLECGPDDHWLLALPEFHIGGLSILARAELAGSRVTRLDPGQGWSPTAFHASLEGSGATLASLVPTQIHDLVAQRLRPPARLRAVLVGGGALAPALYRDARQLGWPVLPTYGMSEASSQVATASLGSLSEGLEYPPLLVLDHLECRAIAPEGRLAIRGGSLLTGYVQGDRSGGPGRFSDPKEDGWLLTEDLGEMQGRELRLTGRLQDRIKIGGELTHLGRLRRILEETARELGVPPEAGLIAAPDPRLETVIHLVCAREIPDEAARRLAEAYAGRVLPFERIRAIRRIDRIPRTELGKVNWARLLPELSPAPSP